MTRVMASRMLPPLAVYTESKRSNRSAYTRRARSTALLSGTRSTHPPEQLPIVHDTKLHDYYFLWGWEDNECAIALGYGSLYNHAYDPNARYLVDIDHDAIEIIARRDIPAGEEITVSYNGDPEDQTPVWFDQEAS